ncbi:MAG: L-glyceraldehyde 3-phosphate reductase [Eubacteriales bacterium]|nr:L-glyceraldehyde 3-phosphate reductase [Eubacteriales bacterium]
MYQASAQRYQSMNYHSCGKSGLKLPAVSMGLWHNFGDTAPYDNMKQLCFTAFDHGITHFDLANNYGPEPGSAEIHFGRIFRENFRPYRDEMLISTKAGYEMWNGPYGNWGSRKYLLASLDQSLQRMGLEYVDIFYHHRMDPETPLEETMGALSQAVTSGKALYVGLSNYNGETLEKAAAILQELHCPFVINQNRYSIFDRTIENNGLKETAARLGKGIIAFSPLAQGMLTDRYLNGIPQDSRIKTDGRFLKESALTKERLNQIRELNELASQRGQSLAEMALSWILRDGIVTSVLAGASKPSQILDNLGALKNTEFTEEELKKIDEISLSQN